MKDTLFEMLMSFFEKSISQLKENSETGLNPVNNAILEPMDLSAIESRTLVIQSAKETSMRIFTRDERNKLTKASYQFLSRLILLGIITTDTMELIINQLTFSDSSYVSLQETKWTIRNLLADNLEPEQLAFLDLVLYQKEDELPVH